jgi:beta-xylosidase
MKMKNKILSLSAVLLVSALTVHGQTPYLSRVWNPDNGNGTYTNPVLYADYSDPDVVAVGEDYYLTASSFNEIPGLPILHSRDLVHWEIIGHALQRQEPDSVYRYPQHGKGVWAPSIRYHAGEYYIYWGDPDFGVMMVHAQNPAGPWSSPLCVLRGRGMIDTCPLWDDDGRCYLVNGWAGSRAGFNSVLTIRELSADGTKVIGQPRIVFDGGNKNHTTEGPKLYKHDGWYWILCPAGGVEHGWQLAMRSRNIYGPYEARTVMAQGTTPVNGPHQGGWVHTSQGEDWFLHFNDKQAYGRVVFLQPMAWKHGWPVIGNDGDGDGCGEPYLTYRMPRSASRDKMNPVESDEFNSTSLGLQWQWESNYDQLWGMPTANGCLRLYTADHPVGEPNLWSCGNLLLQKLPAPSFTATTKLRFAAKEEGEYGGVVMLGSDYQALVVKRVGKMFQLLQLSCKDADRGKAEQQRQLAMLLPTDEDPIAYSPALYLDIYLRMEVADSKCRFSYSLDGKKFQAVGDTFVMRKGKWVGSKMGYVSERDKTTGNRGWIDADWWRVL